MGTVTNSDIFAPKGAVQETPRNTEIYKVSYKQGKNNVYRSIIRFIPFYLDASKNIMEKYVSWVKNPITQEGMYIDDPRPLGKASPISDLYFKLVNTKISSYEQVAKNYLGSKKQYASLVQIIQDEQHPELNGQIKVFIYGKSIWEKLHYEEFPNIPGQSGYNPFNPFTGRYFNLVCTEKSGFNNYDQSTFYTPTSNNVNQPTGIWYVNPETNAMEQAHDGMNRQYLIDYLAANSPDLSKYDVQEWSQEQMTHVSNVVAIIENFISTGSFSSPAQSAFNQGMTAMARAEGPVHFPGATFQPTPAPSMGGFAPQGVPQGGFAPQASTPAAPASPTVPAGPATVPQGGFAPQGASPAPSVQPSQSPVQGFGTVTPPSLSTPQSPTTSGPSAGINLDDVLANL